MKSEEVKKLKQSIKSTKAFELEVEVQSYIDECTRLRHLLEEAFNGRLGNEPKAEELKPLQETVY